MSIPGEAEAARVRKLHPPGSTIQTDANGTLYVVAYSKPDADVPNLVILSRIDPQIDPAGACDDTTWFYHEAEPP